MHDKFGMFWFKEDNLNGYLRQFGGTAIDLSSKSLHKYKLDCDYLNTQYAVFYLPLRSAFGDEVCAHTNKHF